MRWYEYKMEVDDLHASDDLKAKLLALQANAAETPGAKSIAMPAPSPTPKKQKKPLRFPARRWAQLAACAAVCGVCLYGAVYAYEWKGVTLLGGGSSSNYSAAATRAAAPQAAVYSMEDTENATYGSADNGISSFSAEDGYRSADCHRRFPADLRRSGERCFHPHRRQRQDHLYCQPHAGDPGLRYRPRGTGCGPF